jgi:hypothetical protein
MKCLAGIVALLWMVAAHSPALAAEPVTTGAEPAAPGAEPTPPPASAADPADVAKATTYIRDAWKDFTNCRRPSACNAYFESFGVALSFGDGRISPFAHTQRLTATSRDCIKTARTFLEQGDRSLAVQWVMASRIENVRVRDWFGSHPDAVLEALHHCCW